MSAVDALTFEKIRTGWVGKAAGTVAHRYRLYLLEPEDVSQEILLWLYNNEEKVRRWLANEPQQTTRIYRSLMDAGLRYAEREKAAKAGYHVDDVWWYSASTVEGLMPLVLDATFTQENEQVGELISMVIDIRRVMKPDDFEWFTEHDSENPSYTDQIRLLVDRLGGARPYVGRRRAMSNAQCQAITSEQQ